MLLQIVTTSILSLRTQLLLSVTVTVYSVRKMGDAIGFGHVVSRKSERSAVAAHARVHHPACLTIWIRNYNTGDPSVMSRRSTIAFNVAAIVRSHPMFGSVVVNKRAAMTCGGASQMKFSFRTRTRSTRRARSRTMARGRTDAADGGTVRCKTATLAVIDAGDDRFSAIGHAVTPAISLAGFCRRVPIAGISGGRAPIGR